MTQEKRYKFKMDLLNLTTQLNLGSFDAAFSLVENSASNPVVSCEYNDMYSYLRVDRYAVSDPAVVDAVLSDYDKVLKTRPFEMEYAEALMRITANRQLCASERAMLAKAVAICNYSSKHKEHIDSSYSVITSTVRTENDVHHECLLPIQLAYFFLSAEDNDFARFKEKYIDSLYSEISVIRWLLDVESER